MVIPNVLSPEEVTLCRKGLHDDLLSLGVDHNNLAGSLEALQSIQTHQSGGLPLHYSPWRIKYCACNENFFGFIQQLWKVTWAINAPGFECPYAPFPTDSGFALIDSVNFRLPSSLIQPVRSKDKLQKNLGPHVDLVCEMSCLISDSSRTLGINGAGKKAKHGGGRFKGSFL